MTDRTGGCLCGAVRFSVTGGRDDFGICHCKMCQRWTGAFFPGIMYRAFQVAIEGEANVTAFRSSDRSTRSFCRTCGSTLWFRNDDNDYIEIAVGTLDDPSGLIVTHEIFVDVAHPWQLAGAHVRDTEVEYWRKVAERGASA